MSTTHEQKVAMLRETPNDELNGMWYMLIERGTKEAQDLFETAAVDAGFELLVNMSWRRKL